MNSFESPLRYPIQTWVITISTVFLLFSCGPENIEPYAPIETFPEDTTLSSIADKRALIVLAHDDDMCAMSGTISLLNQQGWEINVVSMPGTPERNKVQLAATKPILDSAFFFDISKFQFRPTQAEKNYEAIPKSEFQNIFNRSLVGQEVVKIVNKFKPTVIFSLDNEIGGYGHPEHVFISQLVVELASSGVISPKYIYQSVYTDHMEEAIMNRHSKRMMDWGFSGDGWAKAKETYQVSGMPEPTVQINIESQATAKMNYLRSYNERERKTIGFFIPAFEEYEAETYFSVFDREFFRVVSF